MTTDEESHLNTATQMTVSQVMGAMEIYSRVLGKDRASMDENALTRLALAIAINQASLAALSKS